MRVLINVFPAKLTSLSEILAKSAAIVPLEQITDEDEDGTLQNAKLLIASNRPD